MASDEHHATRALAFQASESHLLSDRTITQDSQWDVPVKLNPVPRRYLVWIKLRALLTLTSKYEALLTPNPTVSPGSQLFRTIIFKHRPSPTLIN